MLERTVGCREPGSLRRILPRASRALKSRRSLHSGFWHHNALDLELSPLCSVLLGGSTTKNEDCELQNHTPSLIQAGFHFDFLYPTGTLGFLRQYMGLGFGRQNGRPATLKSVMTRGRLYTSPADNGSTEVITPTTTSTEHVRYSPATIFPELSQIGSSPTARSSQADSHRVISSRTLDSDYEAAWQSYLTMDESEKNEARRKLVRYLSESRRVVDAERIIEMFEKLETAERDIEANGTVIRSYLRLRNLTDAVILHNTALSTLKCCVGASDILAYMIENSLWTHAVNFWTRFQLLYYDLPRMPDDIFAVIEGRSDLIDPAIELAQHIDARAETLSNIPEMIKFASRLAGRAVINSASAGDERRFDILLRHFKKWDVYLKEEYQYILDNLVKLRNSVFAVRWYRNSRQKRGITFARRSLDDMIYVFCKYHSVKGLQEVMEDFFQFHGHPTVLAYRRSMAEFAPLGDSQTVHALFDQFLVRIKYGRPSARLKASDMAPILHVHAKRGELRDVIKHFDEIQTVHALEPDVLCWNILLDAYGKVGDVEGAFEIFETILESVQVQPDAITFGTIMGICATRGDLERLLEIYQLSLSLNIQTDAFMASYLVLAHIQNDQLQEAERICENALGMNLKGSKTRMWNFLLLAYAMRRQIDKVNQLLQRMSEVQLEYDEYTYAALIQALAMVGQPVRAEMVLNHIMKDAGFRPTSFHYAIVMGSYLRSRNYRKVYHLQKLIIKRRNLTESASTKLLLLKANDHELFEFGTDGERGRRALEMFQDVLSTMNQQEMIVDAQKGTHRVPRHIAYSTMLYSYVITVLGETRMYESAEALYKDFIKTLPENEKASPPIATLSAIMTAKRYEGDWKVVQEFWDIALSKAKEQGGPLNRLNPPSQTDRTTPDVFNFSSFREAEKIVPLHQLDLTRCLEIYMNALEDGGQIASIPAIVNGLLEDGFLLDNKNWNQYIQILAKGLYFKLAFELCEQKLMDNWTGWGYMRWGLPMRYKLPVELRRERKAQLHLRPNMHTFLYLAKAYLDLQDMAAESSESEAMLKEILETCPRVIGALKQMRRTDDPLERAILRNAQ
jgi:pentatricopeptide repeat-containing protein PET309